MEIYELRVLLSPAAGVVVPLQELSGEDGTSHFRGEGFALTAPEGLRGFLQRAVPAVEVRAPADGAVTSSREDGRGDNGGGVLRAALPGGFLRFRGWDHRAFCGKFRRVGAPCAGRRKEARQTRRRVPPALREITPRI